MNDERQQPTFQAEVFAVGRPRVWGWSCPCGASDCNYPTKQFARDSGEAHERRHAKRTESPLPPAPSATYSQELVVRETLRLVDPNKPERVFDESGLRLSEGCVCARLRRPLVPDQYHDIAEGIAIRGHALEDEFARTVLAGEVYLREIIVPWNHGEAHLDFLPLSGRWPDTICELKGNKYGDLQPGNVYQLQRYRYAIDRGLREGRSFYAPVSLASSVDLRGRPWAHDCTVAFEREDGPYIDCTSLIRERYEAGALDFRVLVIDPSPYVWGLPNPEGYRVVLPQEAIDREDAAHELMDHVMANLATYQKGTDRESLWPECTCGQCWRGAEYRLHELAEANASDYYDQGQVEKGAKAERELLKVRLREQVKAICPPDETGKRTLLGQAFKVTIGANDGYPYEHVDYKSGFAALGENASLADLRDGGYASVEIRTGQMRVTPVREKAK